jgi:nucleotide-binding universal stress UspA family protein
MTVLVAVPDSKEGRYALLAAAEEARLFSTDLLVLNLTLGKLDVSGLPADVPHEVLDRAGPEDRDPADAVLDEINGRPDIVRLVLGVRRRSPIGKALLGSLSQRLLLESPIPVVAVKQPEGSPAR